MLVCNFPFYITIISRAFIYLNMASSAHLSGGTADEEPLVNGGVDLLSRDLLVGRQGRKLVRADAGGRLRDSDVGAVYIKLA